MRKTIEPCRLIAHRRLKPFRKEEKKGFFYRVCKKARQVKEYCRMGSLVSLYICERVSLSVHQRTVSSLPYALIAGLKMALLANMVMTLSTALQLPSIYTFSNARSDEIATEIKKYDQLISPPSFLNQLSIILVIAPIIEEIADRAIPYLLTRPAFNIIRNIHDDKIRKKGKVFITSLYTLVSALHFAESHIGRTFCYPAKIAMTFANSVFHLCPIYLSHGLIGSILTHSLNNLIALIPFIQTRFDLFPTPGIPPEQQPNCISLNSTTTSEQMINHGKLVTYFHNQ